MTPARVGIPAACAAIVVSAMLAQPTDALTPAPDTRRPCDVATVSTDAAVDSANARPGDVFRFRLVKAARTPDGTTLPAGTPGYGIVANAQHAEKGGRGGYLALETRFFALSGGRHVAAIIDRAHDEASAALGASGNAPGVLGLLPIVGYAVGGYDSLHHGRDATIPAGTHLSVFIGDDVALGECRPPAAGESPPPVPPPSPEPLTAPAASPMPSPIPSPTPSAAVPAPSVSPHP